MYQETEGLRNNKNQNKPVDQLEEDKNSKVDENLTQKQSVREETIEEKETHKVADFIHSIRNILFQFINEMKENQYIMQDFEISEEAKKTEEQDNYDFGNGVNNIQYFNEGRKSYIRIINKKNWPPTMDDLLEYITIYSQMNSIKFASLNQDKYNKIKPKEEK